MIIIIIIVRCKHICPEIIQKSFADLDSKDFVHPFDILNTRYMFDTSVLKHPVPGIWRNKMEVRTVVTCDQNRWNIRCWDTFVKEAIK
jgi:hypothetical protein